MRGIVIAGKPSSPGSDNLTSDTLAIPEEHRRMTASCSFRILAHQVTVSAPAGILCRVNTFAGNAAEQDIPCRYRVNYSIAAGRDGCTLREEGAVFARTALADDAVLALAGRLRLRILDYLARGGWMLLHAGLATVAGRRTLLAGGPAMARAAAAARLLAGGALVEGADVVAVRDGSVVACPFRLRLDTATAAGLHGLAQRGELPRFGGPGSGTAAGGDDGILVADPAAFGVPWRITVGPAAALLVLDGSHARDAAPAVLSPQAALLAVLDAQVGSFQLDGGEAVRQAAGLIQSARGGLLSVNPGADLIVSARR
jgi:hypothetical protein